MSASSILEDISQAFELWSQQLHNVETKIKRVADFQETLVADLRRKVDASIISEQDSIEFEYIADLWLNLYKSFICCSTGAGFADRDVITYLIELYEVKQISKELFVRIVLELCRNNGQNSNHPYGLASSGNKESGNGENLNL